MLKSLVSGKIFLHLAVSILSAVLPDISYVFTGYVVQVHSANTCEAITRQCYKDITTITNTSATYELSDFQDT